MGDSTPGKFSSLICGMGVLALPWGGVGDKMPRGCWERPPLCFSISTPAPLFGIFEQGLRFCLLKRMWRQQLWAGTTLCCFGWVVLSPEPAWTISDIVKQTGIPFQMWCSQG